MACLLVTRQTTQPGDDCEQQNAKGPQECAMAGQGAEAEDGDRKDGRRTVLLMGHTRSFFRCRHGVIRMTHWRMIDQSPKIML